MLLVNDFSYLTFSIMEPMLIILTKHAGELEQATCLESVTIQSVRYSRA